MADKPTHLMNDLSQPVDFQRNHPAAIPVPLPEDTAFWTIDESRVLNPLQGMYTFSYTIFFTAYHQVMNNVGLYGEVHPHSYRLNLTVQAKATFLDNKIVLPYESIRETLNRISQAYEGKLLNHLPPFSIMQPTTENLTGVLWQQLEYLTKVKPFRVLEITLMESPTIGVTYSR
jgi:6-pyruvoyltetrahydropterin/6-carboxytetrahydropterin synthase